MKYINAIVNGELTDIQINTKHVKAYKPFTIGDTYIIKDGTVLYTGVLIGQLNNYSTNRYYSSTTDRPLVFRISEGVRIYNAVVEIREDNIMTQTEFKEYTNTMLRNVNK